MMKYSRDPRPIGALYAHGTCTRAGNVFCGRNPIVKNYRRVVNKFLNEREIDFDRQFRGMAGSR